VTPICPITLNILEKTNSSSFAFSNVNDPNTSIKVFNALVNKKFLKLISKKNEKFLQNETFPLVRK
jgi:hypothetical protein